MNRYKRRLAYLNAKPVEVDNERNLYLLLAWVASLIALGVTIYH